MTGQSERTILLGTILLASTVSAATGFVLTQYYSVDVLSSVLYPPQDCWLGLPTNIGRHCFNDYTAVIAAAMRPNPWVPLDFSHPVLAPIRYPAAGMVPQVAFGLLGQWLGAPRLGVLGYLVVMTIAVLTPAVWASRGAPGLERVVILVACGPLALPAWFAIDRGNSVGFVVPIALVFLVALCRQRWGLVAIMVVLAALVKPQFAVLGLALLAGRQWRLTGMAVIGGVVTNLAAYLLWPQDFPHTILQSVHNLPANDAEEVVELNNVSFTKVLFAFPDWIAALNNGGKLPDFLAGPKMVLGYAILALVAVCVLALGRRIPPVMAGIVLLATASLSETVSYPYYLVFALPIAALVIRDPDGPPGSGIFDGLAGDGGRRRVVGISVSLAAALSIAAPVALPAMGKALIWIGGQPGVIGLIDKTPVVATSATLSPLLWLIACAAIIVSYTRRPVPGAPDASTTSVPGEGQQTHGAASHEQSG
ncbi:glycosyltransferase family 87 protein [Mycobacterium sp. ML4]